MFAWLKKRILKSIAKDIAKEMPKYKEKALKYIEENSEIFLLKVKEAIIKLIKDELAKALNK